MHNMAGARSCQENISHSSQPNNMISENSVIATKCYLELLFYRIWDFE